MKAFLFTLLIPALSYAQSWAPLGAKWTYTQHTVNPNYITYTTFESIDDTVISGQNCRIIKEIERDFSLPADTIYHYMYSENDKVHFWSDSIWCLLYDFSAQPGDTFTLDCILKSDGQPLDVVVQSVDTVSINGQQRKLFEYVADDLVVSFTGIVLEGIGHHISMFPVTENQFLGPLRCYEDNDLGVYKNEYYNGGTWNQECDQIITGIQEQLDLSVWKVFPNPVFNQMLQIESLPGNSKIQVTTLLGEVMISQPCSTSCELDLSNHPNGMYLLHVILQDGRMSTRKLMKYND